MTPKFPFPTTWDNTMLSAARKCPQSWAYAHGQKLASHETSVHLHAGAAYARGLEVARKEYFIKGTPIDDAIAIGGLAMIKDYGAYTPPPNSSKTIDNMLGAMGHYFTQWPMDQGPAPARIGDSRAIEWNFVLPIPGIKHPETGEELIYCGRFDTIDDYNSMLMGGDDKTTSQLGEQWFNRWRLSNQITGYCVTPDTEVLTEQGWKEIQFLKEGEKIAQWGESQEISFIVPSKIHSPWYKGKLNAINGKVSLIATPDHRQVFYNLNTHKYKTMLLKEVTRTTASLQFISAGYKKEGVSIPRDFIRLLVAHQADGSWKDETAMEFHFTKRRKFNRLIEIISNLGLNYGIHTTDVFSIRIYKNNPICQEILNLLGPNKQFGSWLLSWNGSSLTTFIEELQHWDGTSRGTRGFMYLSTDKNNVEWVRTIASLTGHYSSLGSQPSWKGTKEALRVNITENYYHTLKQHSWEEIDWDGEVYCVTVPSSYFLIRHNNRISVTGNCWGAGEYGVPLSGFRLRGVSILKNSYGHAEAITYRKAWQIKEFIQNTQATLTRLIDMWSKGFFEKAWNDSCSSYGGCDFMILCESQNPEQWTAVNFTTRDWNPLASRD